MQEAADQKLDNAIGTAIDTLIDFSIPLYVDSDGKPSHLGTGFFVQKKDDYFLVSAAHVLDIALSHGLFFYSSPSVIQHLTGRLVRSRPTEVGRDEHVDIGVVKITGEVQSPYPEVRKFAMDISYLKPRYLPRSKKHFAFIGFPATKSKVKRKDRTILVKPYSYRSDSILEGDYARHGVQPETHVVLPLDLRKGFDPDGNKVHFPKPQGMSGAPVVVLYEQDDGGSRTFPVVAVTIEYRKKDKVVVATDVQYVLEAIDRAT